MRQRSDSRRPIVCEGVSGGGDPTPCMTPRDDREMRLTKVGGVWTGKGGRHKKENTKHHRIKLEWGQNTVVGDGRGEEKFSTRDTRRDIFVRNTDRMEIPTLA